ncbi:MAG: hypothetical protein EB023_11160, partial [Flavobacteriia bacterium]|nr:hypothetical protein [Flavobacteriia bacterium]
MRFFGIFFFLLPATVGFSQMSTLQGTVYGENNEPLEGANVIYRNDVSRGDQTDKVGQFKLTVPSGKAMFLIRFTGMRTDTLRLELA